MTPLKALQCVTVVLFAAVCSAQSSDGDHAPVHHVAGYVPVESRERELSADRAAAQFSSMQGLRRLIRDSTASSPWQLLATIPSSFIHDMSFATPSVGFIAGENGQAWKTTDGGVTWSEVLNASFPYEWYGVHALSSQDVILSGFNDQSSNGLIRWSHDGGTTWSDDIVLSTTQWSTRSRFANSNQGLVMDSITGPVVHYTTDGGAAAADWTLTETAANGAWNGPEFSLLPDLRAVAAGLQYCSSTNAGAHWSCGPSVDDVFDSSVFFTDDNNGWVGGGEISPNVEGWIHRTTDGGQTWSSRVLDGPIPIREIVFVSPLLGWAAGGNYFSKVGGIYFTSDGGQTWSLDVDSKGRELSACDWQTVGAGYQVWCAGTGPGVESGVYGVTGASTPTLTPATGTYEAAQSVAFSSATSGATMYYTTDGSMPTTSSTVYAGPVPVPASMTIRAIATAPGFAPSITAEGGYTITPQLQLTAGSSSVSIPAGSSSTVPLTILATANASGVSFSCSGLPAGSQCTFSPSPVNATTAATSVTMTIHTSKLSTERRVDGTSAFLALALPLVFLKTKKRAAAWRRRVWMPVVAAVTASIFLGGCGGSHSSAPAQPIHATVVVSAMFAGGSPATTQMQLTITP